MTLLVPNVGENIALAYLTGKNTTVRNLIYRLFATNVTPAETDTAASYTEASGGGYASITLTGASWTITNGAPTSAAYAQQTYTFTGPLTTNLTIFGYYVVRVTDVDLVLAEAFSSFTPANNGDQILLTPQITCD
jgi:hypothetical protein